jgi:predicted dehydrogenase
VDVEDSAKLILGFKKGIMAKDAVASVAMDFFRRDPVRVCYAVGAKGTLRWDGLKGRIEVFFGKTKKWKKVYVKNKPRQNSYVAQMKEFILCVKKRKAPQVSGADGQRTLKVIDAARLSNQKKGIRISIS